MPIGSVLESWMLLVGSSLETTISSCDSLRIGFSNLQQPSKAKEAKNTNDNM